MKTTVPAITAFLALCFASDPGHAAQMPSDAATALVIFGSDTVRAEVARSPEERQRGLMFRNAIPEDTGMLFVFDRADTHGIWMKDTFVPLDVAFLDSTLRIINIEPLEPLDLTTKRSRGPALFALEVRQGWFADHQVEPGDQGRLIIGRR